MTTIAGAVLAAGAGVRLGRPKATVELAGERLLDRAVRVLRAGGCDPVIAVVRAGVAVREAQAVVNPDPERGMRSSLALAVDAAPEMGALAVLLVDLPGVGVESVRAVVAAWRPGRIAVARYRHGRGHPIAMERALWLRAVSLAAPDAGARALIRACPELVDEVPVVGDPSDLDTPADLSVWVGRVGGANRS